jgi:hypothetical protein
MFDPTISEQNPFNSSVGNSSLEPNSLISSSINPSGLDPFLNSNPQHQLALSSGFDLDYIDRTLEKTVAVSNDVLDGINPTLEPLSTKTDGDLLTGMSINDPLVGQFEQASLETQTSSNSPLATTSAAGTLRASGNLRANRFAIQSGYNYVISGNGNVDFGSGYRDFIDLSSISSNTVKFNFVSPTGSGGVLFNPSNGNRLFDSMTLSNGSRILFEGVDSIRFADGTLNLSVKPNDPGFNSQWNLHMMGVHNAWYFTKGSSKVLIGVQDTGLGVNSSGYIHPDLGATYFYSNNIRDEFSSIPESHGTGVQGIIAAKSNNGSGMSGINWNSPVFNIDVLGGNSNDQSLAQATQNMINFAKTQGQKLVINMSLGGGARDYAFEQLIANNQNNALFVIASGNDNRNSLSYPAWLASYYNNVISVGASWGTRDEFGNSKTPGSRISYPGWWGSNYGTGLTLMGPSEVISTKAVGNPYGSAQFGFYNGQFTSQGSLDVFNGTSAATPNVAGVASLVWSANRNLTASQIKGILSQTAVDLGAKGYDLVYGSGFINADAAVRRALALTRTGVSSLTSAQNPDSYRPMPSADNFARNNSTQVATTDLVGEVLKSGNHQTFFQRPMFDDFDLMTVTAQKIGLGEDIFQSESNLSKDLVNNQLAANTSLEATKSSTLQDAPDYFAGYDIITGMAHLSKLAGLNSQLFEVLEPGIDVYPALAKNVDELVLTHA